MIGYGLLTLGVLALNAWAAHDAKPRHVDALGVSLLLFMSYCVTNVAVAVYGWPEVVAWFPIIDLGIAFMVFVNWLKHKRLWKSVVMACLVFQMACHVVTIGLWKSGGLTYAGLYQYALVLNVAFVIELLVVGGVGSGHVLVRLRRAWASRRRLPLVTDAGR